jgi:hypothetical protein
MSQNLCGFVGGNTGEVKCDRSRGIPKKISVGGKVFQPADYATPDLFQAAFKAAHKLSNGDPDKLYAFPEIGGTTEQTDALKSASLGYGFKQITIEGRPAYTYQAIVGQTAFQKMRRFNRAIVPVYTCDDANSEWGTYNSDKSWNGELAQIFVSGNGFGDGSKAMVADISVAYMSAGDFNDSSKYMPLNFNINEAKGLLDVELSEYAAHAANVYHIQGLVETAQLGRFLNTALDFGADMANISMWSATKADGTAFTITSVAYVTGLGWTVTLDSTMYTALASGGQIFLTWVGPTALDAADVTGLEVVAPLVLVKP